MLNLAVMDYFTDISQINMKQFKSVSDNIISSVTLDLSHGKNVNLRLEHIPKSESDPTSAPRS